MDTYASCVGYLADNIMPNCADLRKVEFTGEGIIFDMDENSATTITVAPDNPRKITAITLRKTAGMENPDGVAFWVDNLMRNPFSGTNHALNVESGRPSYDYSLPIRIPKVDAATAQDIIEPLAKGRFMGVFPTTNGKYFVYGMYGRWNASEQSWNPEENGGDVLATMTSNEPYFVVEADATVWAALKERVALS